MTRRADTVERRRLHSGMLFAVTSRLSDDGMPIRDGR